MKLRYLLLPIFALTAFYISSCRDYEEIRNALEQHTIPGAEYVGMETCAACHEDVVKRHRLESHFGTSLEEGEKITGEACESCHGPGSLHVDGSGDKTKIIRYDTERCFACHLDKKAQFQLQFHHPVTEGQMACMDCHGMHNADRASHSVTDLERSSEKCFKCHKEYKGPFVFEHDAMRDGCQVCHEPHGGVYAKLLVADDNALCLRCHWEPNTNNQAGNIGGVPHGAGGGNYFIGPGENCVDHHRSPHGSNTWRTFNR
ncbi:MAG: hypothetical protein HY714_01175 [Candidatus Omnitrophica bacterium]|nr:hypothetical protein [Candidatus Omnitrophota bacterium]